MLTLCYVDIYVYLCRWGIQSWIMRVLCEDVLVTNHLPKYNLFILFIFWMNKLRPCETCNWNSGVLRNRIWEMDGHVSFVVHTYYLFSNTPVSWLGEADDRIFYSQINHYQWHWKSFLHLQLLVTLKECARFLAPVSGFNAIVPTAVWFLVQIAFNKADFSPVSVY